MGWVGDGDGRVGWNYMTFKVTYNLNHFVIQESYDSMINVGYVDFGLF